MTKTKMNCARCRHTHLAHQLKKENQFLEEKIVKVSSLMQAGRCLIPECNCTEYIDKIEKIDEELL